MNKDFFNRIERIVCGGGGAKGIGYPGCYKAMEETGLLKGVQQFSGASAGAITAAFMAVGMSSASFREQLHTSNLQDMLGNRVGTVLARNQPGVMPLTRDGKPLEQFIRKHLVDTIRAAVADLAVADDVEQVDPAFHELLKKFEENNPRFTFGDLAILNQRFPNKFKQLVIPATQFPGGEIFIFNSELTPNVEIAQACRASASIPIVLEPIEIDIEGQFLKFVDGGVYDNLPTDYFDKDDQGQFTKNKKPEQTIVFAFGEGLDDKKNAVFQALYGHRWDEVMSDVFVEEIIDTAIKKYKRSLVKKNGLRSAEENAELLCRAVRSVLTRHVRSRNMTMEEFKVFMAALQKAINGILLNTKNNQIFWMAYRQEKNQKERVKLLGQLIKEKMKPLLFDAGLFETWTRNVLIESLGDLRLPYKNTAQKELGYQKLRADYALRTVELRVGHLDTRGFGEATKLAHVMDALGYLDTMNYLTNHHLHDPNEFNAGQFYVDLDKHFTTIYQAILYGAGKEPNKDLLMIEMSSLRHQFERLGKPGEVISRHVLQLIKDRVEPQLYSIAAFALSRAVAFHNQVLTADDLFKAIYEEGFKRSRLFSLSNITGKRIFNAKTLHRSLKDKSMLTLFNNQASHHAKTRTDKVFDELKKIDIFPTAVTPVVKQRESELHYAPARFANSRYHIFAANTEQYHINKSLIGLKGDQLKTAILLAFKTSLEGIISQEELQQKVQVFYASDEYKIIAKGQGMTTRMFGLKTSSMKAVKAIVEDTERAIIDARVRKEAGMK